LAIPAGAAQFMASGLPEPVTMTAAADRIVILHIAIVDLSTVQRITAWVRDRAASP
jgi:hypothetical protein